GTSHSIRMPSRTSLVAATWLLRSMAISSPETVARTWPPAAEEVSTVELFEVMRTTGSMRRFLTDPVPDALLYRVLDNARCAPSGGNRQGWRGVIVKDPQLRAALAGLFRRQPPPQPAPVGLHRSPPRPLGG